MNLQTKYILIYLAVINVLTFIIYASDKRTARKREGFRVSEKTLLLLALMGGSPAAWLAQKILRHKTKKSAFRVRFWLIVLFQIGCMIYYFVKYR